MTAKTGHIKIHIDDLKKMAPHRPPGYIENCLRQGEFDGEWLKLTPQAYSSLKGEYSPHHAKCPGCGG